MGYNFMQSALLYTVHLNTCRRSWGSFWAHYRNSTSKFIQLILEHRCALSLTAGVHTDVEQRLVFHLGRPVTEHRVGPLHSNALILQPAHQAHQLTVADERVKAQISAKRHRQYFMKRHRLNTLHGPYSNSNDSGCSWSLVLFDAHRWWYGAISLISPGNTTHSNL